MDKREKYHFTGYIDRIDKIGDQYRVIDYKSGKVKEEDVKFVDKETELLSFQKMQARGSAYTICNVFKRKSRILSC